MGEPEERKRVTDSKKVWTTLITNTAYLSGLLTLDHSLKACGSKYPLVALYTDTFPEEGHKALDIRGVPKQHIPYLLPRVGPDFSNDPRFYDCWSKLTPFSLTEYDRVVQLDSDMLVLKNMDELMEMELDAPSLGGTGDRVFAAGHACVCNPLKKPHYPKEWVHANCAFTSLESTPDVAQHTAPDPKAGSTGLMNGGLQVVNPSSVVYNLILEKMASDTAINMEFADQSLLSDLFSGRWVGLPYVYNALKTMRWKGVHDKFWRDEEIINMHYLLSPKPWEEMNEAGDSISKDETFVWWTKRNQDRLRIEKEKGIPKDGF